MNSLQNILSNAPLWMVVCAVIAVAMMVAYFCLVISKYFNLLSVQLSTYSKLALQTFQNLSSKEKHNLFIAMGLIALLILVGICIADYYVLSLAFLVLFADNRLVASISALSFTLGEAGMGHLLSEACGFSKYWLGKSTLVKRALVFIAVSILLSPVLQFEYDAAYARTIIIFVMPSAALIDLSNSSSSSAPALPISPDRMGRIAGQAAIAIALIAVIMGVACSAAVGSLVELKFIVHAQLLLITSVVLHLFSGLLVGLSWLLSAPYQLVTFVKDLLLKIFKPIRPVYEKLIILSMEPSLAGYFLYPEVVRLIKIHELLDKPLPVDEKQALMDELEEIYEKASSRKEIRREMAKSTSHSENGKSKKANKMKLTYMNNYKR